MPTQAINLLWLFTDMKIEIVDLQTYFITIFNGFLQYMSYGRNWVKLYCTQCHQTWQAENFHGKFVLILSGDFQAKFTYLVVEPTPLKNDGVRQMGLLFPIYGKHIKCIKMFQTSNQIYYGKSPCSMGKSIISTGPCSIAILT